MSKTGKSGKFDDGLDADRIASLKPHIDPLAPIPSEEFDWKAIEGDLNEMPPDVRAEACEVIRRILLWVTSGNIFGRKSQVIAGRRLFALAWVLDPSIFGGISANELAGKLNCVKFWEHTGSVSRTFGITNGAQSHAWNRSKTEPTLKNHPNEQ